MPSLWDFSVIRLGGPSVILTNKKLCNGGHFWRPGGIFLWVEEGSGPWVSIQCVSLVSSKGGLSTLFEDFSVIRLGGPSVILTNKKLCNGGHFWRPGGTFLWVEEGSDPWHFASYEDDVHFSSKNSSCCSNAVMSSLLVCQATKQRGFLLWQKSMLMLFILFYSTAHPATVLEGK